MVQIPNQGRNESRGDIRGEIGLRANVADLPLQGILTSKISTMGLLQALAGLSDAEGCASMLTALDRDSSSQALSRKGKPAGKIRVTLASIWSLNLSYLSTKYPIADYLTMS